MRGAAETGFGRKARKSVLVRSRRLPSDWPCTNSGPTQPNMGRCRTMRGISKSPGPWRLIHKARSCWGERNGPPVLPPRRTGFGTRLIQRNLAAEFDGQVELTYHPDGVECTICAPAQRIGIE